MNPTTADTLVTALEKHDIGIIPDRDKFLEILKRAHIPPSSKFSITMPDDPHPQVVDEQGRYHSLSLRRILRNQGARYHSLPFLDRLYGLFASSVGIHSSNLLVARIKASRKLIRLMEDCPHPFSLLGKFQTYAFDNPDEILFIKTRPLLIIPNAADTQEVYRWESDNTVFEKEVGVLLRHPKRIDPQEYLSN